MANALTKRQSNHRLLARVLDTPNLVSQVRALPAQALSKLVDHIGLEDAGEIVALATTEQVERVFDHDLWRNDRPGSEERFDDERFVVWLEVLLEAGDELVATRLSELPEELVTLAFHKRILVVSLDALMSELGDAEESAVVEKALSDCLSEELDTYEVIARHHEGWDAVLTALLALDRDHHDVLLRVLERCADMDSRNIEERGGLYEVLTSEEMLESDVGAAREDRLAEAGYVAPRAGAAFLKLASGIDDVPITEHDPLTRAYFRDVDRTSHASMKRPEPPVTTRQDDLPRLLAEAGVVETSETPLLPSAKDASSDTTESLFTTAMRRLKQENSSAFSKRTEELAYLANVLVAAWTIDGRRVRPIEGITTAIAACDAGLDLVLGGTTRESTDDQVRRATEVLTTHPSDGLFRAGWKTLALEPS